MRTLQSESASPLYHQLMQRIREDIERGAYPVGSKIPPEHTLEMTYQVSRVTVRRALAELTNAGLLERKQGKGTFVSAPRETRAIQNVHSFHEVCRAMGRVPGTRVLHAKELPADEWTAVALGVRTGDQIIEILRVRSVDGLPVVLEKNHFFLAYAYLAETDLTGSLYAVLREFGVEPWQATHELSLVRAGEEEAEPLKIAPGDPLLKLREVIYDQKGRPLHTSEQWIRGDRFTFRI